VKYRETSQPQYLVLFALGMVVATIMRVWLGIILGIPLLYFAIRGVKGFMTRIAAVVTFTFLIVVMLNQFAVGMNVASADDIVSATDRIANQFSGSTLGS